MATGVIRPAQPRDARRLITVHRDAVLSLRGTGAPYDDATLANWASPLTAEAEARMAQSLTQVAEHAFIAEAVPATLGWFSLTPDGAHVRAFYVSPDFTRRGVGQAMMAVAAAAARSLGNQILSIHASLNAVPFYRAQGFEGETRVRVPLGSEIAIDAVEMRLTLPSQDP